MLKPPPYGAAPAGLPLFTTFCSSWLQAVPCPSGEPATFGCWLRWMVQGQVPVGGEFPAESTNRYCTLSTVPSPSTSPSNSILVLETYTSPPAILGLLSVVPLVQSAAL